MLNKYLHRRELEKQCMKHLKRANEAIDAEDKIAYVEAFTRYKHSLSLLFDYAEIYRKDSKESNVLFKGVSGDTVVKVLGSVFIAVMVLQQEQEGNFSDKIFKTMMGIK